MCKFCTTNEAVEALKRSLADLDMQLGYCPVCGCPIKLTQIMNSFLNEAFENLKYTHTDENGKLMRTVILPSEKPKKTATPINMGIDLDKVNIRKEMILLKEAGVIK